MQSCLSRLSCALVLDKQEQSGIISRALGRFVQAAVLLPNEIPSTPTVLDAKQQMRKHKGRSTVQYSVTVLQNVDRRDIVQCNVSRTVFDIIDRLVSDSPSRPRSGDHRLERDRPLCECCFDSTGGEDVQHNSRSSGLLEPEAARTQSLEVPWNVV